MHLKLPIVEGGKSSYTFGLSDTGYRLNFLNMDYHQSVVYCHPKLVLNISYLKDLDDLDSLNIYGVDGVK